MIARESLKLLSREHSFRILQATDVVEARREDSVYFWTFTRLGTASPAGSTKTALPPKPQFSHRTDAEANPRAYIDACIRYATTYLTQDGVIPLLCPVLDSKPLIGIQRAAHRIRICAIDRQSGQCLRSDENAVYNMIRHVSYTTILPSEVPSSLRNNWEAWDKLGK